MAKVYLVLGVVSEEGCTVVGAYASRASAESFMATLDGIMAQRPVEPYAEVEAFSNPWSEEQVQQFERMQREQADRFATWAKLFPREGLEWFDHFVISEHEVMP